MEAQEATPAVRNGGLEPGWTELERAGAGWSGLERVKASRSMRACQAAGGQRGGVEGGAQSLAGRQPPPRHLRHQRPRSKPVAAV